MSQYKYIREDLPDEYGILALQDKILEIMVYIDAFCHTHGISYCLMGGSALGAVRHGGFIPWDDDLDIFMRPDDYKKFTELFRLHGDKERFYLQELMKRDDMVVSSKLRMNHTTYIEEATRDWDIHQGIFIDIFILHNCPNGVLQRIRQCLAAKYILAKGQSYKDLKYSGIRKVAVAAMRLIPGDIGVRHALRVLYRYRAKETKDFCHFTGKAFFRKGIYQKLFFIKGARVPFEKVELDIPEYVDMYLHERFGDYMALPPKKSIKTAQHAWKWDVEKDFSEYTLNSARDYSDEYRLV